MTPWTPAIAYRRFWQGVMIRYGHPQRVTLVIVARLITTITVLVIGLAVGRWPGAYVGAVALSLGVTIAAFAAWLLALPTIRHEIQEMSADDEALEWQRLIIFYIPLALTSLITMASQPILAFGLSRAPMPLESLAIWPVMMGLLFIGAQLEPCLSGSDGRLTQRCTILCHVAHLCVATGPHHHSLLCALGPHAGHNRLVPLHLWLNPSVSTTGHSPDDHHRHYPRHHAFIAWHRGVLVHKNAPCPSASPSPST